MLLQVLYSGATEVLAHDGILHRSLPFTRRPDTFHFHVHFHFHTVALHTPLHLSSLPSSLPPSLSLSLSVFVLQLSFGLKCFQSQLFTPKLAGYRMILEVIADSLYHMNRWFGQDRCLVWINENRLVEQVGILLMGATAVVLFPTPYLFSTTSTTTIHTCSELTKVANQKN